jgi:asparagine synthetase B (glutamine-hydrolysing)
MTGTYIYTGNGCEIDEAAAWEYVRSGYLPAPRTVLQGRTKRLRSPLPAVSVDEKDLPSLMQQTLEAAVKDLAGTHCAVMFSGGFDSLLVAGIARQCGVKVTGVTVQFDGFNPLTVSGAAHFAKQAGLAHHVIVVKAVEFLSAFEALAGLTREPVFDLDLAIVYAALKKYDQRSAGQVFISGMGSDQWFGNMALEDRPGGFDARLDWAIVDVDAHHCAAEAHGCRFIFPFLSESMLSLSTAVPASMKQDKKLLRGLAGSNTFPQAGARTEVQVPEVMRRMLIKTYGHRAWPSPVADSHPYDQALRQIILGLWFEKAKDRS